MVLETHHSTLAEVLITAKQGWVYSKQRQVNVCRWTRSSPLHTQREKSTSESLLSLQRSEAWSTGSFSSFRFAIPKTAAIDKMWSIEHRKIFRRKVKE